ncbi:MAG: restriction endonuclease subunit S, partial [Cyanobacteria bacterium REEB494]|nr:restriction endonuclease subunit S [Cyanobacteria bacterium REEB494]
MSEVEIKQERGWKRYPAYKDSGVEWLGEIPEGWNLIRLKYGYKTCLGKMLQSSPSSSEDSLEPYLRAANISWEGVNLADLKEMYFSPYEKSLYELKAGDLVVSEGGDVGRTAIWRGEIDNCYIQNAVHRIRNRERYSNPFLYYWLFFIKSIGYIDLLCNKATIAHFTVEKVREIPVASPPLSEQQAIAQFLDRETVKIDTLIAKKERLIELLKEKRTALISHAVTKGLNPDA